MTVVYDRFGVQVRHGDCLDVLRTMPDSSVSAVVTDPPAGIRFMNRAWDSDMGGRHSWVAWLAERMTEALRVLKPGGHAVVWALPRTAHWTAWALEDAGFEIRDCITHIFASGFPKSLDIGKAIDRARNDRADVLKVTTWLADQAEARGFSRSEIDQHMGTSDMGGWWLSRLEHRCAVPTWEQWDVLKRFIGAPDDMDTEVWRLNGRKGTPGEAWGRREVIGIKKVIPGCAFTTTGPTELDVTAPATDAARQWDGWGTALKPSSEMWWLCRKPLTGTVASSVLEHGTGGLNVGATRVAGGSTRRTNTAEMGYHGGNLAAVYTTGSAAGRWPPNTVLSHVPALDAGGEVIGDACADGCVDGCPVAELDRQSGTRPGFASQRHLSPAKPGMMFPGIGSGADLHPLHEGYDDTGGASRFFPCFRFEAKAPTAERPRVNGQSHSTVKPTALMRWLVRLVTPPGGTVLDCFAGTGTTGQAARAEGFPAILIENDPDSIPLIVARLDARPRTEAPEPDAVAADPEGDLFDLLDGEAR